MNVLAPWTFETHVDADAGTLRADEAVCPECHMAYFAALRACPECPE